MTAPHVLLIEDDQLDAAAEQLILRSVGFNVTTVSSVVAGQDLATILLDPNNTQHVVILTDLKLNDLILQRIEGTALVAILIGQMLEGRIRTAPIIAFSNDLTDDRRWEAENAGATLVLPKPLLFDQARHIYQLAIQPPSLPNLDPTQIHGIHLLRRMAERVLHDLRESLPPSVWTVDEVLQLLNALTSYEPPKQRPFQADQYHQVTLLRALGGTHVARDLLKRYALSEHPHPAGPMLSMYLERHPKKAVIHALIEKGWSRTYLYSVSDELPERISRWMGSGMLS